MDKNNEFTIEELNVLFVSLVRSASLIKCFDVSPTESGCIVDTDDVDLVRTLRKICGLIESRVELLF